MKGGRKKGFWFRGLVLVWRIGGSGISGMVGRGKLGTGSVGSSSFQVVGIVSRYNVLISTTHGFGVETRNVKRMNGLVRTISSVKYWKRGDGV